VQDLLPNKKSQRKSRRAKIRQKKQARRGNSRKISGRAVERHLLAVYSGQNCLGSVEQRGDTFTAKTVNGRKLGSFASLKSAADAVSATAEAA